MNIALIGYGKMGHAIERIALERGHHIVLKISSANRADFTPENLAAAEVAIEFSVPEVAAENVSTCLRGGIPVVCGTTGWNDGMKAAEQLAKERSTGFLHASNFSVGVNIFFEINKLLARLVAGQGSAYSASIEEVHHFQKKDKPSGTAITLAEQMLAADKELKSWSLAGETDTTDILPITALREEGVPGTHTVSWTSSVDTIDIRHTAHSRDGFALGAVLAAEFLKDRTGVYTMRDVLAMDSL